MSIQIRGSGNELLYTFPVGFKLEKHTLRKRVKTSERALQHSGVIVSDKKYEMQRISLSGTLGAGSISAFETACTTMKQNLNREGVRLYCYSIDKYFDIKALESADWDFIDWGGVADVSIQLIADSFRYYQYETADPHDVVGATTSFTIANGGDMEVSPVLTFTTSAGASISKLKVENSTDSDRYFEYTPASALTVGDIVEIACIKTTCKLNAADDIAHFFGAFFELKSGDNSIVVTLTGTAGATNTLDFTFRKRYL